MYRIEKQDPGYRLTFGGYIGRDEMEAWLKESLRLLSSELEDHFGVIVDMRTLIPLPPDAQAVMIEGQRLYREKGMRRSAVILNNPVTTAQFQRLAKASGIYEWERYLDASNVPDWEARALAWVKKGTEV
jgi:hypothetical protein